MNSDFSVLLNKLAAREHTTPEYIYRKMEEASGPLSPKKRFSTDPPPGPDRLYRQSSWPERGSRRPPLWFARNWTCRNVHINQPPPGELSRRGLVLKRFFGWGAGSGNIFQKPGRTLPPHP